MLRNLMMVSLSLGWIGLAHAETIELNDGQRLQGSIVSMDAQQLQYWPAGESGQASSQLQTVPRDQIARITFGETYELTQGSFSISKLLREIREKGFDEKAWQDIQKRIQLIDTPEIRRYLDDTVSGLRSDLQQLRRDAQRAQEDINQLREEYGPEMDTLNDYLVALRQIVGATEQLDDARLEVSVDVDESQQSPGNQPQTNRPQTSQPAPDRPGTSQPGAGRPQTNSPAGSPPATRPQTAPESSPNSPRSPQSDPNR